MTNEFKFSQQETDILKNFCTINPQIIIQPNRLQVKNSATTIIAIHDLVAPYDIDTSFGIYDMPNLLSVLSVYKSPSITLSEDAIRLLIKEGKCSNNYKTHAKELIDAVPDARKKFATLDITLDFVFPQEKLVMLKKMADLQKSAFIFFESIEGAIRVTVGDELESSDNTWEVILVDNIVINELSKVVKTNVADLKLIMCDYHVQIAEYGMSKWESSVGVEYYIGLNRG